MKIDFGDIYTTAMQNRKKGYESVKNTQENKDLQNSQHLQKMSDEIKNISETKEILISEGMFDNRVFPCEIVSGSDSEAFKYEKEEIEEVKENLEKMENFA
jgi:hypothetical protein